MSGDNNNSNNQIPYNYDLSNPFPFLYNPTSNHLGNVSSSSIPPPYFPYGFSPTPQSGNNIPSFSLPLPPIPSPTIHSPNTPHTPTSDTQSSQLPNSSSREIPSSQDLTLRSAERKTRWTSADDLLLCSAWLNISTDAIHGTDQSNNMFWSRIIEYYNKFREGSQVQRNRQAVKNRWGKINQAVSKFVGYYQQIENRNESGLNESDKIEKAKELYRRTEDKEFKFIECWNNLKIEQKWTNQSGASPSIRNVSNNDATDGDFSPRPAGRKASKAKDKQMSINVEKEKIEVMNKYIKSTMIHKLLKVNVATLDEHQKNLYYMQMEELGAKKKP
jgi:hypothetical protein